MTQSPARLGEHALIGLPITSHVRVATAQAVAGTDPQSEAGSLAKLETKCRAAREKLFRSSLFSDPGWDILLDLFAAECDGRRVQVSGVGGPATIAQTTAIRWLNVLEQEGLVARRADPLDRRRVFVGLTHEGYRLMTHYFERQLHLLLQCSVSRQVFQVPAAAQMARS